MYYDLSVWEKEEEDGIRKKTRGRGQRRGGRKVLVNELFTIYRPA